MTKARDLANASTALSAVSATELAFLDGVTSAVQTQVDAKIAKTLTTTTGDIIYASGANTPARLGIGSTAQVLTVASGVPSWATISSTPTFVGWNISRGSGNDLTVSNNTTVIIGFNTENYDTDSYHDNVTNNSRITIPAGKTGYYEVIANLQQPTKNATGLRQLIILKNGTTGVGTFETDSINTQMHQLNTIISLTAGDYIELRVYQTSGSTTTWNSLDANNFYFAGQYLGA